MTDTVRPDSDIPVDRSGAVYRHRWLILAVVLAAECMDLIDSTVVNVAAPLVARDFRASSTSLQWIVGGYPLAIAVFLIAGGRLGDLVGRKQMFIVGAAGFVAASVLCGVSPNSGTLIAARLIQGSFAAMMLPQGFGIIRETFPVDERQQAFTIFGPVIGLSSVFGPLLGGGLIDWNLWGTGWRLVFLVNVPIGVAAIAAAVVLLPRVPRVEGVPLDLLGTALVGIFAVLVVYPLIQGREDGWPWWTYASIVGGLVFLLLFWVQQARRTAAGRAPLVTLSVFTHRGYTAGLFFALIFFGGLGGTLLCSTLFLQIGQGFSAIKAALTTVPLSVGLIIGAGLSGAVLGPRFGRLTLQLGVVVAGVGWALLFFAVHGGGQDDWLDLAPGLVLAGAGFGLIVAPLFDIILASVTDAETGSASGVLNANQQLATSIGVAVFGTVFFDVIGAGHFHTAFARTLLVEIATMVALLVISPLLPRFARPPH